MCRPAGTGGMEFRQLAGSASSVPIRKNHGRTRIPAAVHTGFRKPRALRVLRYHRVSRLRRAAGARNHRRAPDRSLCGCVPLHLDLGHRRDPRRALGGQLDWRRVGRWRWQPWRRRRLAAALEHRRASRAVAADRRASTTASASRTHPGTRPSGRPGIWCWIIWCTAPITRQSPVCCWRPTRI